MSVIQNNLLLAGDDQYNLQRSLRFRSSATAYLSRTPSSAGNRKTWTYSTWVKRGALGSAASLLGHIDTSAYPQHYIRFNSDNTLSFTRELNQSPSTVAQLITTQVFRDPSAWYHIVVVWDTTQATANNRMRMYVNGVEITSFSARTNPTQNSDGDINNTIPTAIGGVIPFSTVVNLYDGYLTEINFIDGQALTPSSFGQSSPTTGVWQPKRYTGTYGTNGFYLPFTNNSTTTTLGNDFSGNGNNWTTNNISLTVGATYDSMTDVPTLTSETQANYSVMNPLDEGATGSTISNGNLTVATASTGFRYMGNTMWVSSGKFYAEFTLTATSGFAQLGIATTTTGTNKILGNDSTSWAYESWSGQIRNSNSATNYGATWTTNDVIGICLDKDNNRLYFSKNGVWQNSADPAAGTGSVNISGISGVATMIAVCDNDNGGSVTFQANFGQRPFAYTPPTGFVALNTFNLPTPTIGATASTQADNYFDAKTYTGTGATQTITVDFSSDFAWLKRRDGAGENVLLDRLRLTGSLPNRLFSNSTAAESTAADGQNSFSSSGIVLDGSGGGGGEVNTSGRTYVAWQWKANGTGVTNTAGSITSTVSANTTSGFSVVTYTGTVNPSETVGHGLGVTPRIVIIKNRSSSVSWPVMSFLTTQSSGSALTSTTFQLSSKTGGVLNLNLTAAAGAYSLDAQMNSSGNNYVAYCFAEVAGFSRFGSYTGNGSTDGPFVFCGFRPRFIIWKNATTGPTNWMMMDTARSTFNAVNLQLNPNTSDAESTASVINCDYLSNGFKLRGTSSNFNNNGDTIIYMAFAENPFKYSLAR